MDQRSQSRESGATDLFVGNLPYAMVEAELEYEFTKFGPVADVFIFRTPAGTSRGLGAVRMANASAAQAALAAGSFEFLGRTVGIRRHMGGNHKWTLNR